MDLRPVGAVVALIVIGFGSVLYLGRSPSRDSFESAIEPNAPPTAPIDPYGFAGIANGSGGRSALTSYGAGATGLQDGAAEVFGLDHNREQRREAQRQSLDIFLVPDPTVAFDTERYLASTYTDRHGNSFTGGPSAGAAPAAGGSGASSSGH